MAASGFTPILIYASGTASNVPLAANLTSSASGAELALNYADGKLYFKNSSGVVTLLAGSGGGGPAAGSNTQIQFNNSGVFGASANLTWSGTVLSTTGLTATGAITLNTTTNNQSYTTTGAGTITISSGTAGSINNMTIGGTTAAAGTFTNLTYTGTLTGSTGVIAIGTNQIYKDSSGNVGIGTASPSYKLDVAGVVRGTGNIISGDGSAFVFGTGVTSYVSGSSTSNVIDFYTSSTARMRIDSSGNVGIGTSAPTAIYGKTLQIASGTTEGSLSIVGSTGNGYVATVGSAFTISGRGGMSLSLGTNDTEKMRIDSSGNVGIGTSSPSTYVSGGGLALQGTYGTSSAAFSIYNSSGASASNIAKIDFKFNNTFSTNSPSAAIWALNPNAAGNNGGALVLATSANGTDTTPAERMRIDSSGNVGIGTASPVAKLDVQSASASIFVTSTTGTNSVAFRANNTGGYMIVGRDSSTGGNYGAAYASVVWSNGAYPMLFATNDIERMRIDSSGNVGIGTNSPASKLNVVGGNVTVDAGKGIAYSGDQTIIFTPEDNVSGGLLQWGNGILRFNSTAANERMRIDSSGNLLVGATINAGVGLSLAKPDASGCQSYFSGSAGGYHWRFGANNTGAVGSISTSGSTTTFSTSSDYRLKHDITPMTGALDRVASLKPVTYKWNADNSDGEGFIAHELQAVIPDCVVGEKDAVDADGNPAYQGIDTSFLVATLTAAIQEQQALITSLTARIAALEAA